jgi:hypothetical protein
MGRTALEVLDLLCHGKFSSWNRRQWIAVTHAVTPEAMIH